MKWKKDLNLVIIYLFGLIIKVLQFMTMTAHIDEQLDKVRCIRKLISRQEREIELEADGGVNAETAALLRDAGCSVLVAGSYIFGAGDRAAAIASLK